MGDEDKTDRHLDKLGGATGRKSNKLCMQKYTTRDSKGNKVTRTCIKKKGHWGKHA